MNLSKKALLFSCLLPALLLANEPSAFGAGDLTSSDPYGLTSSEKVLLQTKENLHKVAVKSNNQENQLDSLQERIDGLQSIVESLSVNTHKNKIAIQKENELNKLENKSSSEYQKRISDIVTQNSESLEKQKVVIHEMSLLLDTINRDYISKSEFNSLVDDVNKFKILVAKELKNGAKKAVVSGSKKKSVILFNEAAKFYKKRYYTNAIANYKTLIKRNYKPAFAHYMIGEMNYKRKNYAGAISYFKKSSSLYSKASYMPNLMLHTGVSMKRTGDSAHANSFFKAIVAKYPKSAEAKDAKILLQQ